MCHSGEMLLNLLSVNTASISGSCLVLNAPIIREQRWEVVEYKYFLTVLEYIFLVSVLHYLFFREVRYSLKQLLVMGTFYLSTFQSPYFFTFT